MNKIFFPKIKNHLINENEYDMIYDIKEICDINENNNNSNNLDIDYIDINFILDDDIIDIDTKIDLIILNDNIIKFKKYIKKYIEIDCDNKKIIYNKCIEYNSINCLKYLLNKKIHIDMDLIYKSCENNNLKLVELLLNDIYYSRLTNINNNNHKCYIESIKNNNIEILNLLINKIYFLNTYNLSLLKILIDLNNELIYDYLINKNTILYNEIKNYTLINKSLIFKNDLTKNTKITNKILIIYNNIKKNNK